MKILNLYAGIGGNRKLWQGHDITAVEYDEHILSLYHEMYPEDEIELADAHQYLLDHHKEFDFIWSSPPCPTHSRTSTSLYGWGIFRYPDMSLYQEIIFLKHFFKVKWVVENVIPYYETLIQPTITLDRHNFWSNLHIEYPLVASKVGRRDVSRDTKETLAEYHDIVLPDRAKDKRKLLRNAVNPEIGKHIIKFL